MKILVLGTDPHTSAWLADALRKHTDNTWEIVPLSDEITGTKLDRVIIDDAYEFDRPLWPVFNDPAPSTVDRRRRSKGDKHRNRRHRWGAG